jgi:hypothetical protein
MVTNSKVSYSHLEDAFTFFSHQLSAISRQLIANRRSLTAQWRALSD